MYIILVYIYSGVVYIICSSSAKSSVTFGHNYDSYVYKPEYCLVRSILFLKPIYFIYLDHSRGYLLGFARCISGLYAQHLTSVSSSQISLNQLKLSSVQRTLFKGETIRKPFFLLGIFRYLFFIWKVKDEDSFVLVFH